MTGIIMAPSSKPQFLEPQFVDMAVASRRPIVNTSLKTPQQNALTTAKHQSAAMLPFQQYNTIWSVDVGLPVADMDHKQSQQSWHQRLWTTRPAEGWNITAEPFIPAGMDMELTSAGRAGSRIAGTHSQVSGLHSGIWL